MGVLVELWRQEPRARAFFVALAQGSLATGASYVAVMLTAFDLLPAVVAPQRRMAATALWSGLQDLGMTLGPGLAAGVLLLGGPRVLLAVTAALLACSAALFTRVRLCSAPARDEDEDGSLL